MKLFYVDEANRLRKTYDDLLTDISKVSNINKYIYTANTYEIFSKIIHAIVNGYHVELLDGDFSKDELKNIGVDIEDIKKSKEINSIKVGDIEELNKYILNDKSNFALTLYTSGTTGRPKKVTHNLGTLLRNVRKGKYFKNNIWGFAYNPTHMAGIQVFFQAIVNQNTIIDIFGANSNHALELIKKYEVTHISATPTYYRKLTSLSLEEEMIYPSVKRTTFGGERYDESLTERIKQIFPNTKIRNIYASTEVGAIFTSDGDTFAVPDSIKDQIKFSETGELIVHCSLLGDFNCEQEWFRTGDIVEFVENNRFRFVSRESEMINVGGYKVNPHEVEKVLTSLDFVLDAVVKARDNKITGKILTADVVVLDDVLKDNIKKEIKEELSERLQSFKVPRIINIVDKIEQTRTGKKVRK